MMQAIKKTLIYSSIFNYPLTTSEIHHWLIGKKASLEEIKKQKFPKQNLTERKIKAGISAKKWQIAKKTSGLLSKIPTILAILVTGNLSMNNSDVDDDIDLLIITKTNTLWTTRFLTNLLLDIFKIRRHPADKTFKDKICLNMFLDEDHIEIEDKNLYTAHELLQAKSIFDKNNTYQKFIFQNSWAEKFLPNAYYYITKNFIGAVNVFSARSRTPCASRCMGASTAKNIYKPVIILEFLLSFFQKKYMSSKITKEKISSGQLLFHPNNTQQKILKKYKSLLTNFTFPYKIAVDSKE